LDGPLNAVPICVVCDTDDHVVQLLAHFPPAVSANNDDARLVTLAPVLVDHHGMHIQIKGEHDTTDRTLRGTVSTESHDIARLSQKNPASRTSRSALIAELKRR
jgi:hypothetical protein